MTIVDSIVETILGPSFYRVTDRFTKNLSPTVKLIPTEITTTTTTTATSERWPYSFSRFRSDGSEENRNWKECSTLHDPSSFFSTGR